jgi:Tfp pilus assembly protein PilN
VRNINLLPPEVSARRRVRRQSLLLVVVGIAYLVLLVAVWMVRNLEVGRQEDRLTDAQAQASTLQQRVSNLQEFADLERTVKERQATLSSVMQGDIAWSRLLIELSMIIPGDAWLTSFVGSAADSQQTQTTPTTPQPAPAQGGAARLGELNFGSNTFDFPGVSKWISRLQELKSLQNIWVPTAAKGLVGGRQVINFTSTADLSAEAASRRFLEATP